MNNTNTLNSTTHQAVDISEIQSEVVQQIIEIIFSALNLKHIDRATVNTETSITKTGLNLDSIDILELVVQFENKFKFKFKENEAYAEHFKNVGTLALFIQSRQNQV